MQIQISKVKMILIREKIWKKKFDVIKDRKYIRNIAENKSRETKSDLID